MPRKRRPARGREEHAYADRNSVRHRPMRTDIPFRLTKRERRIVRTILWYVGSMFGATLWIALLWLIAALYGR